MRHWDAVAPASSPHSHTLPSPSRLCSHRAAKCCQPRDGQGYLGKDAWGGMLSLSAEGAMGAPALEQGSCSWSPHKVTQHRPPTHHTALPQQPPQPRDILRDHSCLVETSSKGMASSQCWAAQESSSTHSWAVG